MCEGFEYNEIAIHMWMYVWCTDVSKWHNRRLIHNSLLKNSSGMSIMYSWAVTVDSRKKKLKQYVSSKVRHWCSKFIWSCHSSNGQGNEMLAQWEGIIGWPEHAPPWGVKAVLSGAWGSQFTQGKQTRQSSDKQLGLNKAFRYKGRATTSYLSCLWRPQLPLACLLPWWHLTYIHPSWLTGVRHS